MKKHNVSETGSVSVLRWEKTPTQLGPLERANLNPWMFSSVDFKRERLPEKHHNSTSGTTWAQSRDNLNTFQYFSHYLAENAMRFRYAEVSLNAV
jgi:hypothetical protein